MVKTNIRIPVIRAREKIMYQAENTEYINNLENKISELTSLIGISSGESDITKYLKEALAPLCDETTIDESGNVIGKIYSLDKCAKTLMLEAHMDRIGLMISGIDKDGCLKFANIGGIDERILPSAEVTICGVNKNIDGIVFSINKSSDKTPKISDLRIDTGFSYDYVKNNISVGDLCYVKSTVSKLLGTVLSGAAMDNRAGIASVLAAIEKIDRTMLKYNIDILFAVQEELGLHGAYMGAKKLNADAAIVIDVTHGSTPDSKEEVGVFPLGSGAIICRGPNFNYEYSKQLINIANKLFIPYEIEVASGPSGTDAWAIQISDYGIPSMLVSIPLRYMHTNVETLDIQDVMAVSDLISVATEGGIVIA